MNPGDLHPPPAERYALRRVWLWLGALWLSIWLTDAIQFHLAQRLAGAPVGWTWAVVRALPTYTMLALLTGPILLLTERFPLERASWRRSLPMHVLAAAVFPFVVIAGGSLAALPALGGPGDVKNWYWVSVGRYFSIDVIRYLMVAGAYQALRRAERLRTSEVAAARLQGELTQARLDALRAQLNPHFLFNAMNSMAMLVRMGADRQAVEVMTGLSELLRHALEDRGAQEIPLHEEAAFAARYLEIEQVRFPERLDVRIEVDPAVCAALVPSFLLQPLVENSVRHGVARTRTRVEVRVFAFARGDELVVEVRDRGPGLRGRAAGSGVGIRNTLARLRGLYGDRYGFSLADQEGGGTAVVVRLPLHFAAPSAEAPVLAAEAVRA
jgi:two-component system LytT family sensor kinase